MVNMLIASVLLNLGMSQEATKAFQALACEVLRTLFPMIHTHA